MDVQGIKWVLVVYSFLCKFFFSFGFSIKYKFSIKFRFGFFEHLLHSGVPVFLVFPYSELKLLLGFRRYNAWGQFLGFSRNFRFLTVISGILVLVEFSGIPGLVESSGFFRYGFSGSFRFLTVISGILVSVEFGGIPGLVESGGIFRYGVDFGGSLRLVGLGGFPRFWFGVGATCHRAFLFTTRGGK